MSNQIKLAIGSVFAFVTLATISIEAASATQQKICMKPQQPVTIAPTTTQLSYNILTPKYITPFDLVGSAYQGAYRAHSLPGFASLVNGAQNGTITAKDLVKAAIESGSLLPEMINNRNYLSNVDSHLQGFRF